MKTDFTDREHRRHCRVAGCTHPAVYSDPDGTTAAQGWCDLCRRVAFGVGGRAAEMPRRAADHGKRSWRS